MFCDLRCQLLFPHVHCLAVQSARNKFNIQLCGFWVRIGPRQPMLVIRSDQIDQWTDLVTWLIARYCTPMALNIVTRLSDLLDYFL